MADGTYQPKVYRKQGGDELVVASGGKVTVESGGDVVQVMVDGAVLGGIPVVHSVVIAAGANADTDVILTNKTRVIDAWLVLTGAGVTSAVLTVKNGATAITDGMDASGSDKALVRAATIDDAQHAIAAGGTLRVTGSAGATQPAAIVYVLGIRV